MVTCLKINTVMGGFKLLESDIIIYRMHTRGHSLKLAKKQSNSNLRLYSFSIRVINNWNNLSNHVVSSSNTNTFKNRLDSYWKYHPARYDWEASDYFHPGLTNFDN